MSHDSEKLKKNVDDALALLEALENAKTPVPPVLKQILKAMQLGNEIGMSAEEASQHFALFIKDMDRECGIGDASTDQDDAWICLARRERTSGSLSYVGRLNFTLNKNNPLSLISIHWSKQKRSGWACVFDVLKNDKGSGLFRKCFIDEGKMGHLPRKQ